MESTANDILVIEAGKAERQYWADLWRYRELFYFLAWRDVLVRYKQTAIGVAWSVIRPVLTTAIFVFAFGRIAHLAHGTAPYPVVVYAGMLPWQYFSNCLTDSSGSVVASANMVSKVYFPRIIVPTSPIIAGLVDYAISLVILGVLMALYRCPIRPTIVWLPALTLLVVVASIGPGLLFSALNVKYRDFRYIVPFVVQFGQLISPVGFAARVIPSKYVVIYSMNPLVCVIDGFRYCILGAGYRPQLLQMAISMTTLIIMTVAGIAYFRRTERGFADII